MQPDPAEMSKSFADIAQRSSKLVAEFMQRQPSGGRSQLGMADKMGIAQAFFDLTAKVMSDPFKLAEAQMRMWQDYMSLWQGSMMSMFGQPGNPVIAPAKGDKRFKHDDWQENFVFDYIKQSYLIAAHHMNLLVADVKGLDEQTAKKVNFFTRQYIDALSPSNFAMTNPEVVRATVESGGQNLVRGLSNLLEDLERGDGQLRISMTDTEAFELGKNVATSKGKVVYQNDLMQLLQYEPSTKQVYKKPLLIMPPWINKFYILDLRDKNSFIKWAVDQGHTVFVISWVNPDARLRDKNFENYMLEGPLAALDAIEKATGEREINAVGYCLGGTLLASAMAYMQADDDKTNDKRIASATLLTTLIDFEEPGELGVFLDEQSVESLEKRMAERGYLHGSEMATTFNLLRANDLIWSFVVNNYLLGKDAFPFDLLFWNSDSTRMPATMHSFYLRKMYLENVLKEPNGVSLNGVGIDMSKVKTPIYFLSAMEDHIAPWKATYAGAGLFSGPVKFVLGGSGHIAGVVNPPVSEKYFYMTNSELPSDPEQWTAGAEQHPGSWWTDWQKWISKFAGEKVAARIPGKGKLKAIEDAPGSYVKLRFDAKAENNKGL